MTTVLYADILFIINFSMDFISLCITARLLTLRRRAFRYLVAAASGAFAATAMTAYGIYGLCEAVLTVAVSVLMCVIAYGVGTVRSLLIRSAALWGTGALLGGAVSAVCSLGDRSVIPGTDSADRPFALPVLIGVAFVLVFVRLIRPRLRRTSADVTVTVGDRCVTVPALVDSGNLCADPISGSPVLFLSRPFAEELLGTDDTAALLSGDRSSMSDFVMRRIRAVPVSDMSDSRLVFAFRPDSVVLAPDKSPRDCIVAVSDVPSDHFRGLPALAPQAIL